MANVVRFEDQSKKNPRPEKIQKQVQAERVVFQVRRDESKDQGKRKETGSGRPTGSGAKSPLRKSAIKKDNGTLSSGGTSVSKKSVKFSS